MKIKQVDSIEKLKEVFEFLSELFFDESVEFGEYYHQMSERYEEMLTQFENDNSLLLFIEKAGKIRGALTSKNMRKVQNKITIGVMGVAKEERGKGLASAFNSRI